jgi:hypothetical protein
MVAYKWNDRNDENGAAKSWNFPRLVALVTISFVASALALIFLPAAISYSITISIFIIYSWHLVRQVQRRYSDREGSAICSSFRLRLSRKAQSVIMGYICINCGAHHKLKACPICHSKIKKPWFK